MPESPSKPDLGRIRGSVLVHMRAHIETKHGPSGWNRLVAEVPPSDRDALGGLLINGGWYPIGLWNRGWRAYVATSTVDPIAEMASLSQRISDADLHTVFKLTLKLASATQIVRRSDWLWSRYFNMGTVTIHEENPSNFRVRLEAPTGEDEGPSDVVCTHGVPNWIGHALKLSGATKASVLHTTCRFRFARHCEYRITW